MKILVGSKNPVKIEAVKKAFSNYFDNFEVIGIDVPSNVPCQPINDELFIGAKNRALNLMDKDADFFIGVEGGIIKKFGRWFSTTIICIINKDKKTFFGSTSYNEWPTKITNKLINREELGLVIDDLFGTHNLKQKGGAISYFSKNVLTRTSIYVDGVIMALIPFINEELYQ